ncbi:MAG: hypothetical protein LBH43_21420 [Treponema sp.]|jgi:NTP pyrophosphatase (non-canonical NTP hydrolase)|nr:hypothetical protein [Treponema sp.]
MTLNELRDEVYEYAKKQGFHETPTNLGESLMLVVSELSEALEADRNGKRFAKTGVSADEIKLISGGFEKFARGTVEEEITDAIIRLFDIAGTLGMDLDRWVQSKMEYNKTRPYKHGKLY